MFKFTLVRFTEESQNFAGQVAIQTTKNGQLQDVCDFDGERLAYPGGPNATWEVYPDETLASLCVWEGSDSADGFWGAVQAAEDLAAVHNFTL